MKTFSEKRFKVLRRALPVLFAAWSVLCVASCSPAGSNVAVLWTDRPEFAFYAKYFNASQNRYKVEVFHHYFPVRRLRDSPERPDIVAASWLQGAAAREFFMPLDAFVTGDKRIDDAFYSRLLAKGNFDGVQYLLPVSFNAPLAVFADGRSRQIYSPLTIGLEEMRELGGGFNARTGAAFTRMGFSPTWDEDFLFVAAALFDASFMEAAAGRGTLAWNSANVERAADFIHGWITETNFSVQSAENFTFRFFTVPPANMVLLERVMFTYMDSAGFFTLAEDRRNNLGFRWIAERDNIPLSEGAVYLGVVRDGNAPGAADAFVRWFFDTETQRSLLERSHKFRQMETSFGIAGGFSALRPVTEQIFPRFYPDLLGKIPPEDFFSPANVLPGDWAAMKERVVLPYLRERVVQPDGDGILPLESRLAEWVRLNRF